MAYKTSPHIVPLGDNALLVGFGEAIDEATNAAVLRLFERLRNSSPYILDLIPAYNSLAVYYDVPSLRIRHPSAFEAMKATVQKLLEEDVPEETLPHRHLNIPVCYHQKFALDLDELATAKNISADEVIRLHTATAYRVYMIGFLPGFAYMGKVDGRMAMPRKAQPRTEVPAGAVGIAGEQTGIYPLASPGGWNIIGRTPLKLFDADAENPVLLQPGDEVRFHSITEDEFEDYQSGNS